jgi:hypothetical protein
LTGVVRHSKFGFSTSALGQKQTSRSEIAMSALPPKADIGQSASDVCFVPKADISQLIRSPRGGQNRQGNAEN